MVARSPSPAPSSSPGYNAQAGARSSASGPAASPASPPRRVGETHPTTPGVTGALVVATSQRVDALATRVAALTGQVDALQERVEARTSELHSTCSGLRDDVTSGREEAEKLRGLMKQLAQDALTQQQASAARMTAVVAGIQEAVTADLQRLEGPALQDTLADVVEPRVASVERVVAAEEARASRYVQACATGLAVLRSDHCVLTPTVPHTGSSPPFARCSKRWWRCRPPLLCRARSGHRKSKKWLRV